MYVTGIDPGLVHTGIVMFYFDPSAREWGRVARVIDGPDVLSIKTQVLSFQPHPVFIEAYKPRSHFSTDKKMVEAVHDISKALPKAKQLDNSGVKKVVTADLLKLLDCWTFPVSTHHQDLRAAARIGLYGALKDDGMNLVIAQFVIDHLDGTAWTRL